MRHESTVAAVSEPPRVYRQHPNKAEAAAWREAKALLNREARAVSEQRIYKRNSWQAYAKARQQRASKTKPRMGVCVTGQLARLELESKMRRFVNINLGAYAIDLVLMLAPASTTHFVNKDTDAGGRKNWTKPSLLATILRSAARAGNASADLTVLVDDSPQDPAPFLRFEHVNQSNKWQGEPAKMEQRVRSHVRQWQALWACWKHFVRRESETRRPFDVYVKLRDDSYVFDKWKISRVLYSGKVVFSNCLKWKGYNDKAAVMDAYFGYHFFASQLIDYVFDYQVTTSQLEVQQGNPETYLMAVMERHGIRDRKVRLAGPDDMPVTTSRIEHDNSTCVPFHRSKLGKKALCWPTSCATRQRIRCVACTVFFERYMEDHFFVDDIENCAPPGDACNRQTGNRGGALQQRARGRRQAAAPKPEQPLHTWRSSARPCAAREGDVCGCVGTAIYARQSANSAHALTSDEYTAQRVDGTISCTATAFGIARGGGSKYECFCRADAREPSAFDTQTSVSVTQTRGSGGKHECDAAPHGPRVALCFFGVNRSLNRTIASIRARILKPLRERCAQVDVYFHTYSIERLTNAWSAEDDARLGGAEEMIAQLSPIAWSVSSQREFDRTVNLASYTRKGLYGVVDTNGKFKEIYTPQVVLNLLRQLNSLRQVTRLWSGRIGADDRKAALATAYDVVGYLRPDLLYLDDLDVDRLFALHERAVLTPSWQTWHGMNDRFAFAPPLMAARFGNRLGLVQRFVADRPMHSETFARFAMVGVHNASLELTHMRGLRVRANGEIAENDRCLEMECGPGKKRCANGCQNSDDAAVRTVTTQV